MEKAKRTSPSRILDILEAIILKPDTASAATLSKSLNIPLPTVYRQLETLTEGKFIVLSPAGLFIPGARFRQMIMNSLTYEAEGTRRRAILRKLSGELEETVSLSVPDGAKLVYFDRFESNWPVQVNLHVGDPLPLHCCASGKLYLSSFDRNAALEVFRDIRPDRRASNTIITQKKFDAELQAIADRGYALDDEEWFDGMVGAAVPVLNKEGKLCACLSTHALTTRKSADEIDADISYMLNAAKLLEVVLFDD